MSGPGPRLLLKLGMNCSECDCSIDSQRKAEAMTFLRLFGLKKGWRVCRCWERIIGTVDGVRRIIDIVSLCDMSGPAAVNPLTESIPNADAEIVRCPPSAANDALTHAEWQRRG